MKRLIISAMILLLALASCRKTKDIDPDDNPSVTPATSFSVSNVFQNNMVIQRDKPFVVWGQDIPKHVVQVTVSWLSGTVTATADDNGYWKVTLPASAANISAQSITCKDGADVAIFDNILIGDVWICSGQSNMTMQVDAIAPFTGVLNYQQEIASSNYPNIRAMTVADDTQTNPLFQFTNPKGWVTCSPQTTGKISAVAYFFARKLNTTLNVPIGIIISSINGSWCESWTNQQAFQDNADVKAYAQSNNASTLYNGMINPLVNLQIKGFLWYQGENNQHLNPASIYTKLNTALIKGWRAVFNQPDLPFYYVQLTPFAEDYNNTTPPGGDPTANWLAKFREAQAGVLATPNTGMAITMDVGEAANHHPRDKKPVGERLALLALKNTYNQNVECYGPRYSNFSANGRTVTVNFVAGTANGLNTINNQPLKQLFYTAGPDHVFRLGSAQINGSTITVTASADTPLPVQAVRYAFNNAVITNLQNSAGLPAEPFRTDNWDN